MSLPELRKHLESSIRERKREQEKKEMQQRYERTAAIKKVAAQEQSMGDIFLTKSMDML